jgi:O-succinylbenzoate synthase
VLVDGHIDVPTGPGIGVDPIREVVDRYTVSTEWV